MTFEKMDFRLKDGEIITVRSADEDDAETVLNLFNTTHAETDFMLTGADESPFDVKAEREFLKGIANDEKSAELVAFKGDTAIGSAGFHAIGSYEKIKHRADFGIGILKAYWGLGLGKKLTELCIELAKQAGYLQIELEVVSENAVAVALYESFGFAEYGRNPKGFKKPNGEWQELVLMRKEL